MDFNKTKYNVLKAAKDRQINVADHIYYKSATVLDAALTGIESSETGFEVLAQTKQATDVGRSLLGKGLCMALDVVTAGAEMVLEQEPVKKVGHDVARISDKAWDQILDRFVTDEETKQNLIVHKEAAEW